MDAEQTVSSSGWRNMPPAARQGLERPWSGAVGEAAQGGEGGAPSAQDTPLAHLCYEYPVAHFIVCRVCFDGSLCLEENFPSSL